MNDASREIKCHILIYDELRHLVVRQFIDCGEYLLAMWISDYFYDWMCSNDEILEFLEDKPCYKSLADFKIGHSFRMRDKLADISEYPEMWTVDQKQEWVSLIS